MNLEKVKWKRSETELLGYVHSLEQTPSSEPMKASWIIWMNCFIPSFNRSICQKSSGFMPTCIHRHASMVKPKENSFPPPEIKKKTVSIFMKWFRDIIWKEPTTCEWRTCP